MGNFSVCDVLSILFEIEKPPVKHLEGSILLPRKVVSCRIFSKLSTENSSSRTQKNSPIGLAKGNASMVGGMFAVVAMNC
jgi:hypothetical protein